MHHTKTGDEATCDKQLSQAPVKSWPPPAQSWRELKRADQEEQDSRNKMDCGAPGMFGIAQIDECQISVGLNQEI